MTSAQAFGPYFNPYDGTATVTTGKKKGALVAAANATTADGTQASVTVSGKGPKGIQVTGKFEFLDKGKGSLTLTAKVLADPAQIKKGDKLKPGKPVVVNIKAKGTYTVVDATTVKFTFSGNSGKGGGTNVTGTFSTDVAGNMSLSLNSGFKQKVSGVGRRIGFVFDGASATTPTPTPMP
jgi:hypothetical protein